MAGWLTGERGGGRDVKTGPEIFQARSRREDKIIFLSFILAGKPCPVQDQKYLSQLKSSSMLMLQHARTNRCQFMNRENDDIQ